MEIWKALVNECSQYVKEPSNEVGKNIDGVTRTNSRC